MPNKRPVVMVFGRFNPPTIGHEALIQYVQSIAHRVGGDVRVYPSQSQDARKNPLPFKNKVRFLRSFFPSVTISDNISVRTPIDALAEVSALGYTDVILVAGSDRVRDFEKLGAYLLPRSSPKYDATKHIPIDHYRVVGVPGDRDPDAEGVAGMSASKMRKLAAGNDMASFMQGIPRHVSQIVAKDLFKQVRQYMGLHERFNIAQGQFAVGLFEAHDILKPGTTVRVSYKGHRATGKIVRYDKGDGPHGTPYYIVDVGGQHSDPHAMHRSEKFPVHAVVKEDHIKVGDTVHAGLATRGGAGYRGVVDRIEGNYVYVNIGKDKFGDRIIKAPHSHVVKEAKDDYTFDATAIEHNKVVDQMWGLAKHEFPHAVTMFRKKHPHATISFMNKSGTVVKVVKSGENLKEAVGRVHGLTAQDQLRGARVIYRALTNTDAPHGMMNPIDIINASIPLMLKAKHVWGSAKGWHTAGEMLTKARKELGIDWNVNLIKPELRHAMRIQESETQVDEAETPAATKPPSETERLRSSQQQELIALKTRQANAMMAAKLRDVQMKAREAQLKTTQPKPAAKPAS